jgi:hypothetical protein
MVPVWTYKKKKRKKKFFNPFPGKAEIERQSNTENL